MAGVGKSVALIVLGHDEAVRDHFRDGTLYMAVGAKPSVEMITRYLSRMMGFTGARERERAAAVRKQTDLTEAVDNAAI